MRSIVMGALLVSFLASSSALAKPPAKPRPGKTPAAKPAAQAPAAAAPTDAAGLLAQGKKLMKAGQYAKACPMIADSQRMSPQPSTLLDLGICHEKQGKIATAFGEFNTVVLQTRAVDPSAKEAQKHIASLGPSIPKLTISVPPGAERTGLQVTLDGLPVATSAWGIPNSIDPGPHQVAANAKGQPPWSTTVTITKPGEMKTVEVPAPGAPAAESPEAIAEKEKKLEDPFMEEKAKGAEKAEVKEEPGLQLKRESRPFMGYLLFGTGLVATGVGSYYGVQAIQQRKDSDHYCFPGCTQQGVDLNNKAKTSAWIADFGIGLGAVGIVVGGLMLLKTPPLRTDDSNATSLHVAPAIGPTTAGVSVGGAW